MYYHESHTVFRDSLYAKAKNLKTTNVNLKLCNTVNTVFMGLAVFPCPFLLWIELPNKTRHISSKFFTNYKSLYIIPLSLNNIQQF